MIPSYKVPCEFSPAILAKSQVPTYHPLFIAENRGTLYVHLNHGIE